MTRQVFLFDNDISDYVITLPNITLQAPNYGQLLISDYPVIVGNNIDGFWDKKNSASPFKGSNDLQGYRVQIKQNGVTVFTGSIQQIQANNDSKTAQITLRSDVQKALEKGIIFASSVQKSPSETVVDICNLYNIPVDSSSFGYSSSIYAVDNVLISALWIDPGVTVLEAIQQIAEIGCARVFLFNDVLYFQVYEEKTSAAIYEFSESLTQGNLWSNPQVTSIQKEKATGYSITWTGEPVATFGDDSGQFKSITAGYDSPIRIESLQAAVWIGEKWLSYLNRDQEQITFQTDIEIGSVIPLLSPVSVEYEGWSDIETVDIIGIDNGSNLFSVITGETR